MLAQTNSDPYSACRILAISLWHPSSEFLTYFSTCSFLISLYFLGAPEGELFLAAVVESGKRLRPQAR
jgi:hypothetical protein